MNNLQASHSKNDAWAAIKGFVYQVNLSVLEWVRLNDDEHLELEKGEDIDKIIDGVKDERQLGQVKHLDTNITLRTPAFKESVVNCFEHLEQNPKIKFLFISNAKIGRENKVVFYDDQKNKKFGLQIWKLINQGQISSSLSQNIDKIKEVIQKSPPAKFTDQGSPSQKWKNFISIANDSYDFNKRLIKKFYILDNQQKATEVKTDIKTELISKSYANNMIQADQLYKTLFYKIFELISQKDPEKKLHKEWFTKIKLTEIADDQNKAHIDKQLWQTLENFHIKYKNYLEGKFDKVHDHINEAKEEIKEELRKSQEEIDINSFKDVEDEVFNDFQLEKVKNFLNNFKAEIVANLTPQEIHNITTYDGASRLFLPFTREFVDKIKKKGLWKGWLNFLTYLYVYSNKVIKPESSSKINIDNLTEDCRLYFSGASFSKIIRNIVHDQKHIDDIISADSLFFITEEETVKAVTMKKGRIIDIINGSLALKLRIQNHKKLHQQITSGDLSNFPKLNHISIIDREVDDKVNGKDDDKIKASIKRIIKEIFTNE